MTRDSFIMYASFYEPLKDLTDSQLGQLLRALFAERMGGECESHLADMSVRMAFRFITNQFAVDDRKWEAAVAQRRAAAARSVEIRQRKAAEANARKRALTGGSLNVNDNENVNVNVNVNEKGNVNVIDNTAADKGKKTPFTSVSSPARRFVRPTLEDVKKYVVSGHFSVDAEHFYSYYESNGWKVGKNPMKDWKAAVRSWHAKDRPRQSYAELHPIGDFTHELTTI